MKIYLTRHGSAEDPAVTYDEDGRQHCLTGKGREKMRVSRLG